MNERPSAERGQVLVVAAIFMVVLLVSGALAVDYGSWLSARREFQSVSDAASLAAAAQLPPPGQGTASSAQQQSAAVEALVYLNDHLGWGQDRAWAQGQVALNVVLNKTAPLVVSGSGYSYCVWIWTPTPSAAAAITGAAGCMGGAVGSTIYSPATYPSDGRKVLVRIQSFRPAYLARIAGFSEEMVSAIAVAGGAHVNYAVIALKPRLGSPDSQYGVTINGGSHLIVPNGDVGGNYSLQWGGSGASIDFSTGQSQVVDLNEPGTVQGSGNVVNGTVHQLEDFPIPDPLYGAPPSCTATVTSPCWNNWPPTIPVTATNKGVYPACASPADINNHRLDLSCLSNAELALPVTIWPGKYEQIKIPAGAADVRLSSTCFTTDTECLDPNGDGNAADNRGGIFYLSSSSSSSGLLMNGTPGSPSMLTGCGVLLIFDPHESGGSRVQMNVAGNGNTLNLNASACNMKISPPTIPTGTTLYRWYGYGASDFTNPISVWVRPNGSGYDMTSTNNGSNVITMGSGATINENGVIYAPEDNTMVSGGPAGSGVGQIVAWTITYTGSSNITESFQGPAKLRTRLYQ